MSESQTSDEIRKGRIEVLGEEFGLLYDSVYTGVLELFFNWFEYKELFASKESRIKLLNEAAPSFFYIVQRRLWESILLHICRLTDPAQTAGKRNASINSISQFITDEGFGNQESCLVVQLMEASSFSRDWRNRYISHSDFDLAINLTAKPLEEANSEKVERVLELFQKYINLFQNYYFNVTTALNLIDSRKGVLALLRVLDDGLESKKKRFERIKSGKHTEDDFKFKQL